MIDALIRWSIRQRSVVLFIAMLLLGLGAYHASRMPVDVFPDLTAPTVTIITEAHGMAPTEVESQVTLPIEAAVNGAPGVRRVRSSTAVGISVVWVEFAWGSDIYAARQVVAEKVSLVAGGLPPGVERPVLAPISSIMGEILFISLTADEDKPDTGMKLRTVADTVVRRRLLSVPGVSQVTPIGGGEKQYQVIVSPSKLREYDVSLGEVTRALAASNENVSAGFMNDRGSEYLVTGLGRVQSVEDIRETVVARRGGVTVRVRELAEVSIAEAPKRGEGSAKAEPAVILGIQKQPGANTLALTRELDSALDRLQADLGKEGIKIDRRIFRQSDFIEVSVRNVQHALRDGAILVVIVVFFFLANLRAGLITITAIPLSLLAAVLALSAFGATFNTMTLGGMAIAIGALVDDAIINVENVFRRLRENGALPEDRRRTVFDVVYGASREVQSSIVFATLIILLVFVPIFFLPGVEGRLLQPLGLAYVVALSASLVVALTVTPVLCSFLLPRSRAVREGREPRVVRALKGAYGELLGPALRHPWAVVTPAIVLFAGALIAFSFTGRAFLPEFNEGAFTISAVTLPGTSLPESDRLGRVVEETLLSHPEVASVARRTGRAELDEHAQGVEAAELDVSFVLKDRSRERFLEALRRDLSLVPGMNITVGQPISHRIDHMLSGTRANIAVKIFGDDLYKLRSLGERCRQAMSKVEGVVDLSVEQQMEIPILRVRLDRSALSRYGILVEEVMRALEASLQGIHVSRVMEGRNSFDLVARLSEGEGWNPDSLEEVPLSLPDGGRVPLGAVADVVKETGPNTISRENVERKIVVMCNVSGRDVGSVVEDIRKAVDPIVAGDRGYRAEYGGQFEAATEANRRLAILGAGVIVGIWFLLYLAFRSGRDAAVVMVNLPLALIGGIGGVFLSGGVLSVASIIGFITVFGIATRNGIMLISHIRNLQEHEGVTDFREAVYRGALERLAPILMTALAAGLALIPLALGGGKPGNEIQTPMALVVLLGLLSSMLLNMIVVPALYLRFGKPIATGGGR
ncbi:MAG: efflux RND transporter permease subunit [Planctomycetes bacterium]|nr:efflux RND transporter permease subunit [Planctomycetota bacterium]